MSRQPGYARVRVPVRVDVEYRFGTHRGSLPTVLPWTVASHIHQVIDAHNLPVTHVTRRTGRPFTLVLVETEALFARSRRSEPLAARSGVGWVGAHLRLRRGPQALRRVLE